MCFVYLIVLWWIYIQITVSTIGYGDVEPNNAIGEAPLVVNIFIYTGLALVAILIGTIQDLQQNIVTKWRFEQQMANAQIIINNANSKNNDNKQHRCRGYKPD